MHFNVYSLDQAFCEISTSACPLLGDDELREDNPYFLLSLGS